MLQFWARPTCILDVMRRHGQMLQPSSGQWFAKDWWSRGFMGGCHRPAPIPIRGATVGLLKAKQWFQWWSHGLRFSFDYNSAAGYCLEKNSWEIPVDDQSLVELPYHVKSFAMMHLISLPVPPLWASGATG